MHNLRGVMTTVFVWAVIAAPGLGAQLLWKAQAGAGASGPPYPSASVAGLDVFESQGALPAVQRGALTAELTNVLCDGSVRPASLLSSDAGAAGGPGPSGFIKFFCDGSVSQLLQGDILINAFGDGSVRQQTVLRSATSGGSAFDILFDTRFGDGSVHRFSLHGDLNASQPLALDGMRAVEGDGSVRVAFDLGVLPGTFDLGAPVLTMALTGTSIPEPATMLLLLPAGLMLWRPRAASLGRRRG